MKINHRVEAIIYFNLMVTCEKVVRAVMMTLVGGALWMIFTILTGLGAFTIGHGYGTQPDMILILIYGSIITSTFVGTLILYVRCCNRNQASVLPQ